MTSVFEIVEWAKRKNEANKPHVSLLPALPEQPPKVLIGQRANLMNYVRQNDLTFEDVVLVSSIDDLRGRRGPFGEVVWVGPEPSDAEAIRALLKVIESTS